MYSNTAQVSGTEALGGGNASGLRPHGPCTRQFNLQSIVFGSVWLRTKCSDHRSCTRCDSFISSQLS